MHVQVPTAAILTIGDEVLRGDTINTNATFLGAELTRRGVAVKLTVTITDNLGEIVRYVGELSATFDHVIVSGGIGPTPDDVTRPAIAEAFGQNLEFNQEALQRYAEKANRQLNPGQREMCRLPADCELLWGQHSVAPGFRVQNVYVFPGVPEVLKDMWLAVAGRFSGPAVYEARFKTRIGESRWAHVMARFVNDYNELSIGSYPQLAGNWFAEVVVRGHDAELVNSVAAKLQQEIDSISEDQAANS